MFGVVFDASVVLVYHFVTRDSSPNQYPVFYSLFLCLWTLYSLFDVRYFLRIIFWLVNRALNFISFITYVS